MLPLLLRWSVIGCCPPVVASICALILQQLRRNSVVWCLVLLDPDGGALLREQRFTFAAPLSAKWPLERVCVNPWINHGCVHRE